MLVNGHLYRSDTISYELPEVTTLGQVPGFYSDFKYPGRTITVHIRPNGPAHFIIEHSAPDGFAWFDTP